VSVSERERQRIADLVAIIPPGDSVLDVGARDGVLTTKLLPRFRRVVAVDLNPPQIPGAECRKANACDLPFGAQEFDVVACTEVLEHVPEIELACSELLRVAREAVVVGVPYRQDLRVGRLTCSQCGLEQPAYGHVHGDLDEDRVSELFPGTSIEFHPCGPPRPRTNAASALLMSLAGNPYGGADQQEPCIECGAQVARPRLTPRSRALAGLALRLDRVISPEAAPNTWLHAVIHKNCGAA